MCDSESQQGSMFSYVDLESQVPKSHPLRRIRPRRNCAGENVGSIRRALCKPLITGSKFPGNSKFYCLTLAIRPAVSLTTCCSAERIRGAGQNHRFGLDTSAVPAARLSAGLDEGRVPKPEAETVLVQRKRDSGLIQATHGSSLAAT